MKTEITEWTATDTDTNSQSTATKAAPAAGQRHYVTFVTFSASAAPAAAVLLTIKQDIAGTPVTLWHAYIPANATAPVQINFVKPIRVAEAKSVSLDVGALGAGVISAITIGGYTGTH